MSFQINIGASYRKTLVQPHARQSQELDMRSKKQDEKDKEQRYIVI